jgi:projectin
MKKINRNLKPFMFICIGLMAVMLMSATSPCEPPGKPRNVEIADYGNGYCTIRFKSPRKDGGSPITNYIVEKRDARGGRWEYGAEGPYYELKVIILYQAVKWNFVLKL